ncbi:Protein of unknown function [Pyronema omphalodes CBS 100304]|uniref:Uncharacterized protein n=1 Tax=Pyronema omphalodes (strain CBS 100304) TaxID=1076935 RepID=U4L2G7_PYROM|nr:Protein of unknown function [Pyronema omphalodes CBS 100304]
MFSTLQFTTSHYLINRIQICRFLSSPPLCSPLLLWLLQSQTPILRPHQRARRVIGLPALPSHPTVFRTLRERPLRNVSMVPLEKRSVVGV